MARRITIYAALSRFRGEADIEPDSGRKLQQLGDVGRDASGFVAREQTGRGPSGTPP